MAPPLTATVTTTHEITLRPTLRRKLLAELRVLAELDTQLKALELAKAKHKDVIETIRAETGEDKLSLEGFTVTRVPGAVRRVLDEKKLIALYDLSVEELDACRVEKVSASYTKVTLPGVKEE
jgi:hypothetical protein